MPEFESNTAENDIHQTLKKHTSNSIIDKSELLFHEGCVVEASRTGSKVSAIVKDIDTNGDITYSTSIEILPGNEFEATCSCSTPEEMAELWCIHAGALLFASSALDFLTNDIDKNDDSFLRNSFATPEQISKLLIELPDTSNISSLPEKHSLQVVITPAQGELLLFISIDDQKITSEVFDSFKFLKNNASYRPLEKILFHALHEDASWDIARECLRVRSGQAIERLTDILKELSYVTVKVGTYSDELAISDICLNSKVLISWKAGAAVIQTLWELSGEEITDDVVIMGDSPKWGSVGRTLYRLTETAEKIVSMIPSAGELQVPRISVAPILESLTQNLSVEHVNIDEYIIQKNINEAPTPILGEPVPSIEFSLIKTGGEHFSSKEELQLKGALTFVYPPNPKDENIVILPNREQEQSFKSTLENLGFINQTAGIFAASGDSALDIIQEGSSLFSKPWLTSGLDLVSKQIKFADLNVNISVNSLNDTKLKTKASDWFTCNVVLEQNKAAIPISVLFRPSKLDSDKWVRLDSGAYAKAPGGSIQYLRTLFGFVDPQFSAKTKIEADLDLARAISLSKSKEVAGITISSDKALMELQDKLSNFSRLERAPVRAGFTGQLRSYQEEGLSWLHFLNEYKLGGILADEMGLGKTVQTLAFIHNLFKDEFEPTQKTLKKKTTKKVAEEETPKVKLPPVLVVAPTSVVVNWQYEARRFAPDLKVLLLQGPERKNHFAEIPNHHICITSYALLRLDQAELEKHEFMYVILDEAQNIKNPSANVTKAAKRLRARAKLALTGTPTENRPLELWSIMDFVMPGYLGTQEFFKNNFDRPITEQGNLEEIGKLLQTKTKPFMLRRRKSEVEKDLPPKLESVLHVQMKPSQAQLYAQVLEEIRPKVLATIEEKGVGASSISILSALLRLRQICNHPNSIESLRHNTGFESGKFELFQELIIEALQAKRKILVFCQFIDMLSLMKQFLQKEGIPFLSLDGSTKDRQDLIDEFNSNEDIRLFLISLKAGGTGLNLTSADTVVIYDPWWNPAVEDQAIDRAHRIGQTKAVTVYRLVTEDTVEQRIMALKEKKTKIIDALVNDKVMEPMRLSRSDIEALFAPVV